MRYYKVIYNYTFNGPEFELIPNFKNGITILHALNEEIASEIVNTILKKHGDKISYKIKVVILISKEFEPEN